MNVVIKIGIAFFAATYNNSLIVIHPALHRNYDASISTRPVRPLQAPFQPRTSLIQHNICSYLKD